jgi:LuxR family maltose regulon positive regulatory protein
MSGDLLQTKLYVPKIRPFLVPRPRLIQKLNTGQNGKLTLISAPAGFGKTTLISSWIYDLRLAAPKEVKFVNRKSKIVNQIAWLSLDSGDNDSARFLAYMVAAVQTIAPAIGERALALLQSPQLPPIESILTSLLNEITTIQDKFVLVLDDYHTIDDPSIDRALTFLLEHLPPQMHLVIATREDPNLPLARYRVRGQMTELRANDLRFTPSEASEFLNQVMGLNLSAEEIAALEARTEGWIAGLQIAALALQGQSTFPGQANTANFIQAFTGSHRFVMDYLVEEILQQQPEHVRSFLIQTSILNSLSGPLCDAVTEQESGKEMLLSLERGNLFIISLDGNRQWYRYHHLFADVLHTYLMEEQPDQIPNLHLRASKWYETNDLYADAIRHAFAANDFEQAAALAEMTWQMMDGSFQFATWLGWVKKLPDELICARPVLCTQYASALSDAGELEASESRLRDAERCLSVTDDSMSEMVVADEQQFRSLPARIALIRAGNAQIQGNISDTKKYAELALQLTPEDDALGRAQAITELGFINWTSGNLEAARQSMADWIDSMQQFGNIIFAFASYFALADLLIEQGRLQEAIHTYQQALRQVSEDDQDIQRIISIHYLGLAMLYHEVGDGESFSYYLQKSQALSSKNSLINWPYRWCIAQAKIKESEGDLESAIDLLDEAKRVYVRHPVPDIRPIEALQARLFIKQGQLSRAMDWVRDRQLSVGDDLRYLREFEHITLARVLIAGHKSERADCSIVEATELLERLLEAAEAGKRFGSVIEILMLQAIAHQVDGDTFLAFVPLERALTLAEHEGYVRIFVDEGQPIMQLLRAAAGRGIMPDYAGKLLAAFAVGEQDSISKSYPPTASSPQPLVEPLSQRELEVLRLLKTELSGPEIARELVVALSTVRTHTKSIYSKLNVNSRRTAVKRATELNLI